MRKRKDAMALFELIGRDKLHFGGETLSTAPLGTVAPPRPVAPPAAPASLPATPPAARNRPTTAMHPAVLQALTQTAPKPAPPPKDASHQAAGGRLDPLLAAMGRRLQFTLNFGQAVAAGAALVVLLIVVFVLGRASVGSAPASTDGADELAAALGESSDTPPVRTSEQAPARAAMPVPKRVSGKYYLIIQTTLGAKAEQDAVEVARWLVSKGEPAQAVRIKNNFYVLSLTPFDAKDDPRVDGYAKSIEVLGKQYLAESGRYKLSQTVDGQLQPLFYREP